MESYTTDWKEYFKLKGIVLKNPPFGLASAPVSSEDSIAQLQAEFGDFIIPEDYKKFALQIGPGTLGRVRIFAYDIPQDVLSFPDPRMHNFRLQSRFADPEYSKLVPHQFDLKLLCFFAQDTQEDLWFGWKLNVNGDYTVYAIDEQPRSPPPRKIAQNFIEFVESVCLGVALPKAGLRKYTEDPAKDTEPIDPWDSDEEVEYEVPAQTFTAFAVQS